MRNIDKKYFGAYLTGVFEASGGIYIPKNNYPKIYIYFQKKNKALAEALRERIGFGYIYENRNGLAYEIFNKAGILKFIEITQKYLRTPKIEKYNNMIEYLNNNKKTNLPLTKIDNSDFDSNGWLSGYLESNGGFLIYPSIKPGSITSFLETGKHSYYTNYHVCFTLTLKKENKENYRPFLQEFAVSFDTILHDHIQIDGNTYFTVRIEKLDSISMLLEYLEEFPVFGARFANYLIIKQAFKYQKRSRVYLTSDGIRKKMKELKEQLNKEILDYKAEHLDSMPYFSD